MFEYYKIYNFKDFSRVKIAQNSIIFECRKKLRLFALEIGDLGILSKIFDFRAHKIELSLQDDQSIQKP